MKSDYVDQGRNNSEAVFYFIELLGSVDRLPRDVTVVVDELDDIKSVQCTA